MADLEFSLPPKVTELSLVPDELRDFYRASNEGNYYVRVDPKKLGGTADETRRSLQAMMAENERLKERIQKFEGIDIDTYNELMEKKEELMTAEAVKNGEIETIRRSIEAGAAEKIKKAEKDREIALAIAQAERLNSEFEKAFEAAGVSEDETTRRLLRKDLIDYIVPQIDIDNRKVGYEVRDLPNGSGPRDPLLNDEGKPMKLGDLVKSRRQALPWAFAGSEADGGGSGGGAPAVPISAAALEGRRIIDMSPAEKNALYKRIGSKAYFARMNNEEATAERQRRVR